MAPYFGHPEIDLALVDYFHPVPDDVFDAEFEVALIEDELRQRRDIWRTFVDPVHPRPHEAIPFSRYVPPRLAASVRCYK